MSDLIPCALCGQPAVTYDHDAERNVCDEHDGGFNSPLPQATRTPWPESELARRRERVAKTVTGLHGLETARWLATLDAERARFARLVAALPRCAWEGCAAAAHYKVTCWYPDDGLCADLRCSDHLEPEASDADGSIERLPWADLLPAVVAPCADTVLTEDGYVMAHRHTCDDARALQRHNACYVPRRLAAYQRAGECAEITEVWKSSDLCRGTKVTDTVERVPRSLLAWWKDDDDGE